MLEKVINEKKTLDNCTNTLNTYVDLVGHQLERAKLGWDLPNPLFSPSGPSSRRLVHVPGRLEERGLHREPRVHLPGERHQRERQQHRNVPQRLHPGQRDDEVHLDQLPVVGALFHGEGRVRESGWSDGRTPRNHQRHQHLQCREGRDGRWVS